MKLLLQILVSVTVALAQIAPNSNDPPNVEINNRLPPGRVVSFNDVVSDPALHSSIKSYEKGGDSRIVGGDEVEPHSVPHQAYVSVDGKFFCGGSLISNEWVLTSAHCVDQAKTVSVILGVHNIYQVEERSQQKINSTAFKMHPKFNRTTNRNDVALIKLLTPAMINEFVSPACLVNSKIQIENGTTMVAIGWGRITDYSPIYATPGLRSVAVQTISNEECLRFYADPWITNGTLCTSNHGGTEGICDGDYGGPLTISGKTVEGSPNKRQCQAGISSFRDPIGCQTRRPSGYTRVSYYIDDFITKETGIEPCNECSGSNSLYPSILALFCSLIVLFQFKIHL